MRHAVLLGLALACASPAQAQVLPTPGYDNPRIQSITYTPDEEVIITALPDTGLTVVLDQGEKITRITAGERAAFDIRVSPELNSFEITPRIVNAQTSINVKTDSRSYSFSARVDAGLMAAYLVRFDYGDTLPQVPDAALGLDDYTSSQSWTYRLRGDAAVRPLEISDDGRKTRITYGEDQALPAVFAVGPTGDEEVVNGYMRDGLFVIDRVYQELVFRIDKSKATAKRKASPEAGG